MSRVQVGAWIWVLVYGVCWRAGSHRRNFLNHEVRWVLAERKCSLVAVRVISTSIPRAMFVKSVGIILLTDTDSFLTAGYDEGPASLSVSLDMIRFRLAGA